MWPNAVNYVQSIFWETHSRSVREQILGFCGTQRFIAVSHKLRNKALFWLDKTSARNRNLEVPVYFLKAKQGYKVRKM
jgi:hypothetical protein